MDEANRLDRRPDGIRRQDVAHRLQDRRAQPAAGELLRLGRLRLLGVPPPRRAPRRGDRRDHLVALSRRRTPSQPMLRAGSRRRRLPAHRPRESRCRRRSPRSRSARSRSATSCSISGRMFTGRDAVHAHLMKHEPPVDLRGAVLYHCGPVVVKDDGERVARHGRRPDDQHPRRAVPGGHHQALRRARGDRQGRDGREDARRAEGVRRRLPECHRRRRAVLRALHRARGRRLAAWSSARPKRCGTSRSGTSRRSSRWTRTATACTRTSRRRRAASSRRCEPARPRAARSAAIASAEERSRSPLPRASAILQVDAHDRRSCASSASTSPSACARFSTANE